MKKGSIALMIVVVIILAVAIGYYAINELKQSRTAATQTSESAQLPALPDVIKSSGGIVKGVYGAMLGIEINNRETEAKGIPALIGLNVTSNTKITKVITDEGGKEVPAKLSEIKIGDAIRFWSNSNIRDAEQVDVTAVQLVQ